MDAEMSGFQNSFDRFDTRSWLRGLASAHCGSAGPIQGVDFGSLHRAIWCDHYLAVLRKGKALNCPASAPMRQKRRV